MFKLFGRRKKNKQSPPQDQQVKKNKDIPVSHVLFSWNPVPLKGGSQIRNPHQPFGFLPPNETPKWENKESRE